MIKIEQFFNLTTQEIYDLLSKWKGCRILHLEGRRVVYELDESVPIREFTKDILPHASVFVNV